VLKQKLPPPPYVFERVRGPENTCWPAPTGWSGEPDLAYNSLQQEERHGARHLHVATRARRISDERPQSGKTEPRLRRSTG
jgi:hypothetical protein